METLAGSSCRENRFCFAYRRDPEGIECGGTGHDQLSIGTSIEVVQPIEPLAGGRYPPEFGHGFHRGDPTAKGPGQQGGGGSDRRLAAGEVAAGRSHGMQLSRAGRSASVSRTGRSPSSRFTGHGPVSLCDDRSG